MATITGLEHCKFLISDLHTDICTYRYRYICIYNIQHDLKSHSVSLQDIASQINNTFDLNQLCGDSTICCMENIFLGKNRVASTASKQVFDYTTQRPSVPRSTPGCSWFRNDEMRTPESSKPYTSSMTASYAWTPKNFTRNPERASNVSEDRAGGFR